MSQAASHTPPGQHQTFHPKPGIVLQLLHGGPIYQAFLLQVAPATQYRSAPHEGEELRYVVSGEVIFEVDGKDYPAVAGATLCHSASVTHGFRTERRPATFVTFALAHGYDVVTLFRGAGAGETGADGK